MEKKQEEKNTEKVKKRTSLKNIIGGDILATDFFRRQAGLLDSSLFRLRRWSRPGNSLLLETE